MRELVRLIDFYKILIFIAIFGSWLDPYGRNRLLNTVRIFTDPILNRFRFIIRTGSFGIDLSPILVIWGLGFLQRLIIALS